MTAIKKRGAGRLTLEIMLTSHQLEWLRARLESRSARLAEEIRTALHPSHDGERGLVNHRTETDDDAVADREASLDVATLEREVRELRALQEALRRLAGGEYGVCADCGEDIPYPRLRAEPEALRCIACQQAAER